jgi:uncharacterized membrane protein YraQ (UPF0718 family)
MDVALWIVAGVLAAVFLVASTSKVFVPKEKLARAMGAASQWVEDFSPGALKAIGAVSAPGPSPATSCTADQIRAATKG